MSDISFFSRQSKPRRLLRMASGILCLVVLHSHAGILDRAPGMSAEAFARQVEKWDGLDKRIGTNLARFIRAYPQAIMGVLADKGKPVLIRMANGTQVVFEDANYDKTFEQRLETSDVNEMLADFYPPNLAFQAWPENLDPGRYRSSSFLKAVYGADAGAVGASLDKIPFCGKSVSFQRANGAAAALAAVGKELEALAAKDATLRPYLDSLGGTFAWRPIAGSQQLSAHCFAIAIDLNPDLGGYWRWEKGDMGAMKRRTAYPAAIISAFERHGFVWGGKWYHFDLMHFEFRPEFQGRNPYAAQTISRCPPLFSHVHRLHFHRRRSRLRPHPARTPCGAAGIPALQACAKARAGRHGGCLARP